MVWWICVALALAGAPSRETLAFRDLPRAVTEHLPVQVQGTFVRHATGQDGFASVERLARDLWAVGVSEDAGGRPEWQSACLERGECTWTLFRIAGPSFRVLCHASGAITDATFKGGAWHLVVRQPGEVSEARLVVRGDACTAR